MAVNDPRHSILQDRLKLGHAVSQSLRMQFIVYLMDNLTQKGQTILYRSFSDKWQRVESSTGSKARERTAFPLTMLRVER